MPSPPVAARKDHREIRHGETVNDEYHWLREKSNPEVIQYLEAENQYTDAVTADLQPFVDTLYREMLGRIVETDMTVPVTRGEWSYYSRTEQGRQYPIHCRRQGADGAEEILLDLNELAGSTGFVGLGAFVVSDDQNQLAYTLDLTGFRQYRLHVKDLRSGHALPITADRVTSVQWAADNQTLFFTTEDETTKRSDTLWRTDEPVYHEKDPLYDIELLKSRDRKYLFLNIESKDTTECRYLKSDEPLSEPAVFLPREKGHRYYPDHREDLFYIRTNKDAVNFRIVTAPDTDAAENNWRDFIPHLPDVLIFDIDLFATFAVAIEKSEALNRLRVHRFNTADWTAIPFPEPVYSARPATTPDYHSATWRYRYESLVTPSSVFDYDPATGQSRLLKRQEVPGYDPSQYASERLWAHARDGVKVPISIVHNKAFPRDSRSPMLLYGYGSYGYGISATFSGARLSLLDRGVSFAIAHIRGGDERGEQWRLDGMLMKKKNTFHDFIDCAEFLIAENRTCPDKLIIEGGSAGGLLMGTVINMRPDLFRAVHAAVPFVDVINTMMDASLPLTEGEYLEWGNPGDRQAYEYMRSYSPYDNLEKQPYPAILITTSLNDSQVMYWEPAKYVARLRQLKTDANPLLLRTRMEPAGHGGASGRYDKLKEQAFEYAWMLRETGL